MGSIVGFFDVGALIIRMGFYAYVLFGGPHL